MPADDSFGLIPEDLLGALIEVNDALLLIDADDRIGGDAENAGELRLGLPQGMFGLCLFGDALLELRWRDSNSADRSRDDRQRRQTNPRANAVAPELSERDAERNHKRDGGDPQRRANRREWTTGTGRAEDVRSRREAELQRELNVVRTMRQAQLFLNALLVRVDGLRADEQASRRSPERSSPARRSVARRARAR